MFKCSSENGELHKKYNYIDGHIEDGKFVDYYDNGQILWSGTHKDGRLEGELIKYEKNGFIDEIKNYSFGRLHGHYKRYNKNKLCDHRYYENENSCYRIKIK